MITGKYTGTLDFITGLCESKISSKQRGKNKMKQNKYSCHIAYTIFWVRK